MIEVWQIGHEDPYPHAPDFDWRPKALAEGVDKEERYRGSAVTEPGTGG